MIVRLGRDVRAERQKSGFVRILGGGAEDGAERCGEMREMRAIARGEIFL